MVRFASRPCVFVDVSSLSSPSLIAILRFISVGRRRDITLHSSLFFEGATVFALNDHRIRRFSRSSSADSFPLAQNIYTKTRNEVREVWHSQIVECH